MINKFFLKIKLLFSGKIRSFWSIRCKVSKGVMIERNSFVDKQTTLGLRTYVGIGSIISNSFIGPYCSIGPYVKIGLGEHDFSNLSTSQSYERKVILKNKTVLEGDNWVGTGAFIKQGVKLGFGSIIGANSVVTKNTENFGIYVGSPAKLIRYRFQKDRQEEILKSKWWEKD